MDSPFRASRMRRLGALMLPLLCGGVSAHPEEFDIVIYGGTSGGVTAAVQGAKMGKKVAIVSPTPHLGGLSSSGLGWTDLGNSAILGGLSREFYHRVYLHYKAQPNWAAIQGMGGQGGAAFNTTNETGSIFEPKVAEGIFNAFVAENNIPVFTGLLDLDDGVIMDGQRITGLKMEDGRIFRGKMFIDAGYEGDVLAGAGVTFTIGREANSVHSETISGVQSSGGNQVSVSISAYNTKNVPGSGLLPGIETGIATNGTGDHRLQAYCYRMCLTNSAANRVAITQPPGYNAADFELVIRAVEAGQTGFFKTDGMPNSKTDSNNSTGISTDYIGKNYGDDWNWATLNHQQRAALAKQHEYWQRGLMWTIQNHPRVRAVVTNGLATSWGLPADEFTDNGNWPYQLYVREARRMVSDYVMTQHNCRGTVKAPDSIGLAAYTMDSHNTQRYVNASGLVRNEGDVQQSTAGPYPVSYRSIVPKIGECENLLVPWCLSASHMAFGSIRMEPVFMTLGQSAATAAAIAINDGTSVQAVPYEKLAAKLRADGQALRIGADDTNIPGIVVDNTDTNAEKIGDWITSTATAGFYGDNYIVDGNTGQGTKSVRYRPVIPASGTYEVTLRWAALGNRATNVPVKVFHRDGVFSTTVNQELNGGVWNVIGSFYFEAGSSGNLLIETTGANEYVVADAARWMPSGSASAIVNVDAFVPATTRGDSIPGEFVFTRQGDTAAALAVNYTVSGNASPSSFTPILNGVATIPAGVRERRIAISAAAAAIPAGAKTIHVQVNPAAAYLIGTRSGATVTLNDRPFDAWRFNRFNNTQLGNPAVSGASADPDGNGLPNLLDFFTGGSPVRPSLIGQNGNLYLKFRRHRDAAFMKMKVWESPDLTNWTRTPELVMPELYERIGDFQEIGIPLRAGNAFTGPPLFFRLQIEE